MGYPYNYYEGENLTPEEAKRNLTRCLEFVSENGKISKQYVSAFTLGLCIYAFLPSACFADEIAKSAVSRKAKIAAMKRASNAASCMAIAGACKAAKASPAVTDAAIKNPQLFAAFACGASIAWCTKYALFDR